MANRIVYKDIAQSAAKADERSQLMKQLADLVEEQRKQPWGESVITEATKRFADVVLEASRKTNQSAGEVDLVDVAQGDE